LKAATRADLRTADPQAFAPDRPLDLVDRLPVARGTEHLLLQFLAEVVELLTLENIRLLHKLHGRAS
jgi:hypothetical protein